MWVCSREGFPLTVFGCSTAAGSSRYSSESIFIIDIQLLRDFGETEPTLGHGTWVMWLRFCNENMKASYSLLWRLLCVNVSLLTCLCEYLCILYRWLLVAVYLERLQAAREQENLSSIEETLLNIAYVEQELWILREDKTFKWVSNWKLGILRKVEWQWSSPAPPCPCLLFAGSSLTKSLRC